MMRHLARPARIAQALVATVAVGIALVVPAGVATGQDPTLDCASPFPPAATATDGQVLPPLDATPVSRTATVDPTFDSDGDGTDDEVALLPGVGVEITRGDGVVTLTAPGVSSGSVLNAGDLDGDGRDEITADAGGATPPDAGTFLVPGTVAPGTSPVSEAGIRVGDSPSSVVPVDDGSDRLLVAQPSGGSGATGGARATTGIYSARAVLALGPGADIASLEPSASAPGFPVAFADLGGDQDVVIVKDVADGTALLTLLRGPSDPIALTTTTSPSPVGPNDSADLLVLSGPAGDFVDLSVSNGVSTTAYRWDLGDLCAGAVPPVDDGPPIDDAPTPAPAAEPITTAATFTG